MHKTVYGKWVAIVTLSLMVAMPVLPAVAQDDPGTATDTVEVVEDENVGILPTNPFYFLKEWTRGFRRAFIFDPIKRAEFELKIVDEKADEMEEVSEGADETGVERAAENYEKAVERLRLRLERVEGDSENPNVQALLEQLTERAERHEELIERLRLRYEEFETLRLRMEELRGRVEETIGAVGLGVGLLEEFRESVRMGDAELKIELQQKMEEFREGVLRERFELRQIIDGEEMRFRFENRFGDDDDDDEDELEDEDEDEEEEDDDDDDSEDDDDDEDEDEEDEEDDDNSNSGSGSGDED